VIETRHLNNLVTHCDSNYLPRALVLIESLARTTTKYSITLVCHDELTFSAIQSLSINGVNLIKLNDLEAYYPELKKRKQEIKYIEYLFLITPFIIKYCLEKLKLTSVAYVDSDVCFFSAADPIFNEVANADVGITSHNFTSKLKHLSINGNYNVGIVFFRNSKNGLLTVNWWAERCLESTSIDSKSIEIFGDQKYLDLFTTIYPETHVYSNFGINAAPWNCIDVQVDKNEKLISNGRELVCFHFSGLKLFGRISILGYYRYGIKPTAKLKKYVYRPYASDLYQVNRLINSYGDKIILSDKIRIWIRALIYGDFLIRLK